MKIFKIFLKKEEESLRKEYLTLKQQLESEYNEKLKTVIADRETYDKLLNEIKLKEKSINNSEQVLKTNEKKIKKELAEINEEVLKKSLELVEINNKLGVSLDNFNSIELFENCGLYSPMYDYNTSELYKETLAQINNEIKLLIKNGSATIKAHSLQFNNSTTKGEKIQNDYSKLLLRAFNGEVDLLISKVKWNTFDLTKGKIDKIYNTLNKLTKDFGITINNEYLNLKIKQLHLEYELDIKLKEEKELAKEREELIKADELAAKEAEKISKQLEKEAKLVEKAITDTKKLLNTAHKEELSTLDLKIKELEAQLLLIDSDKERALSMAQITKKGFVYIISNIGSFGKETYKIGLTRRLNPEDRIKELSGASVPFKFDTHSLIYSEDAPDLESFLHQELAQFKVNKVNNRKEFFKTSSANIKSILNKYGIEYNWVENPEAKEYYETLKMLK